MKKADIIFFALLLVVFLGRTIWTFGANPDGLSWNAEGLGVAIGAAITLCLYSFLYHDNALFKASEHLFVGVGMGYLIVTTWLNILKPDVYKPLLRFLVRDVADARPDWWLLVPVALGLMLLLRVFDRLSWMSRIAFAFLVGYGAGIAIPNVIHGIVLKQTEASMSSLIGPSGFEIKLALILLGVVSVLVYFFFSVEHRGVMGGASRVGVWFLMISFGASFGYTVMGRMALFVERAKFLLADWLGILR